MSTAVFRFEHAQLLTSQSGIVKLLGVVSSFHPDATSHLSADTSPVPSKHQVIVIVLRQNRSVSGDVLRIRGRSPYQWTFRGAAESASRLDASYFH